MGVFDKALKTASNIGKATVDGVAKVGSNVGVAAQDNSELAGLKMQVNAIEQELDASYVMIGRKYVEYILASGDMGPVDVSDTLKLMDPKITKKQELEAQIVELEKKLKDQAVLREKQMAEQEFLAEKSKLDKALQMDVMTQDEYNLKLAKAQKKYDNFEEIRRIEAQCDMGIITKEEKNAKIDALMS